MLAVLTTSWARTRPKLSATATPSRRSSTATRPNSSAMYSSALSCSRIRELVPAVCARRVVEQVDATGRWAGQRLDRHDLAWLRGAEKDFRPPPHLPTLDLAFNYPRAGQCIEVEAGGVLVDTDRLGDGVKRRCGGKPLEMLEDSSARRTETRSVGVPHLRTPAPCCPTQVHFTMES